MGQAQAVPEDVNEFKGSLQTFEKSLEEEQSRAGRLEERLKAISVEAQIIAKAEKRVEAETARASSLDQRCDKLQSTVDVLLQRLDKADRALESGHQRCDDLHPRISIVEQINPPKVEDGDSGETSSTEVAALEALKAALAEKDAALTAMRLERDARLSENKRLTQEVAELRRGRQEATAPAASSASGVQPGDAQQHQQRQPQQQQQQQQQQQSMYFARRQEEERQRVDAKRAAEAADEERQRVEAKRAAEERQRVEAKRAAAAAGEARNARASNGSAAVGSVEARNAQASNGNAASGRVQAEGAYERPVVPAVAGMGQLSNCASGETLDFDTASFSSMPNTPCGPGFDMHDNLIQRFPDKSREEVAAALEKAKGHAGKAAAYLRSGGKPTASSIRANRGSRS